MYRKHYLSRFWLPPSLWCHSKREPLPIYLQNNLTTYHSKVSACLRKIQITETNVTHSRTENMNDKFRNHKLVPFISLWIKHSKEARLEVHSREPFAKDLPRESEEHHGLQAFDS